ncbi:MAG: ABC transporter substrate-binding protein [Hyphomicrobiaceae bacterium]|nr:ABC transporter substrate-binding protein [Hyphomicrobiaceae bacterium]
MAGVDRLWQWRRAHGAAGLLLVLACAAATITSKGAAGAETASRPQRIVSINLCTDQLLIDLVERERISALSRLAADPVLSAVSDRTEGIKLIRGRTEEVLALRPDLVVTSAYSTPEVVALLRRVGVRVERIPMASDIAGIRNAVRELAKAVGETERGEAMLAAFDQRLAAAAPRSPFRPTALAYQVNSLTSEPGGLIDAALTAAGFVNVAGLRSLGPAGRLPLETFVSRPPDLVVLAHDPDAFHTVTADNLRHRAFRDLLARRRHVHIPMPLWLCGTPKLATAVEQLGRERAALQHAAMSGHRSGEADGASEFGPGGRAQ